jgi:hypothetical protein
LLKEHGVSYVSPLGDFWIGKEKVAVLPFDGMAVVRIGIWTRIKRRYRDREEEFSPADFRDWLMGRIDEAVKDGGFLSILSHPFL